MKNNVVITMLSIIESDGDTERMEFTTEAKMFTGTSYRISYDTDDGSGCKYTMIRAGKGEVVIYRKGGTESHMTVQKDKRYVGHYDIGVGGMMVGVSGKNIEVDIAEDMSGRIYFEYAIDINSQHVSNNSVEIKVKPIKESI